MVNLNNRHQTVRYDNGDFHSEHNAIKNEKNAPDKIDNSNFMYLFGNKRDNEESHRCVSHQFCIISHSLRKI